MICRPRALVVESVPHIDLHEVRSLAVLVVSYLPLSMCCLEQNNAFDNVLMDLGIVYVYVCCAVPTVVTGRFAMPTAWITKELPH